MPTTTDQTRIAFLAKAPDLSGFAWPADAPESVPANAAPPTSRVHIARAGKFSHPRYGRFSVTRDTFDSFIRNLAAGIPTPELPVDIDHAPEMGGPTAACGWIKGLSTEGTNLYADVEWNWDGAWALREKRYKYVSPTWVLNYVDDEGRKRGPTLLAFALTNRPFFSGLAGVTLARLPRLSFAREELAGIALAIEDELPTAPVVDELAIADAEATFDLLEHAGALEPGHRQAFVDLYPANAAVIAEHGDQEFELFLAMVRSVAIARGHAKPVVSDLDTLDADVRELADRKGTHWWEALAELARQPSLATHAPPPIPAGVGSASDLNDDIRARLHAHRHEIS